MTSEYVLSLVRADQPIPPPALPELAPRRSLQRGQVQPSQPARRPQGTGALSAPRRGKTRALNVFDWGGRCYLVDIPGYGWSKAGQADRADWRQLVTHYIADRPTLAGILWLLDIRRDPSADDITFGGMLARRKLPVMPVLTKGDKIGRTYRADRIESIANKLGLVRDTMLVTSALTREGQEELREAVLAFSFLAPCSSSPPAARTAPRPRATRRRPRRRRTFAAPRGLRLAAAGRHRHHDQPGQPAHPDQPARRARHPAAVARRLPLAARHAREPRRRAAGRGPRVGRQHRGVHGHLLRPGAAHPLQPRPAAHRQPERDLSAPSASCRSHRGSTRTSSTRASRRRRSSSTSPGSRSCGPSACSTTAPSPTPGRRR